MGADNSSETRVRPVFEELLTRPDSSWLGALLRAAPNAEELLTPAVLDDPGELIAEVRTPRSDGGMLQAFEHRVFPPDDLLRWLIENAPELTPPRRKASAATETKRERLRAGDESTKAEAMGELDRCGPTGSAQKWWAFEGPTYVDCWLETDRLVLFIEGKRKERLSENTSWLKGRNQLVRNLELVAHESPPKPSFALLAVEHREPELDDAALCAAAPHLGPAAAETLRSRYLGQLRWPDLCAAVGFDYGSLPGASASGSGPPVG